MTDLIKQARELYEGATPGPWKVEQKGNTVKSMAIKGVCCGMSAMRDDYRFIAASRTLVPALADALEKAQGENRGLSECKEKLMSQNKRLISKLTELTARAEKSEAERDMALEDLLDSALTPCTYCGGNPVNGGSCDMKNENHDMFSCWQWRGAERSENDANG